MINLSDELAKLRKIGEVRSYYGGLFTITKDDHYYWAMESYDLELSDMLAGIQDIIFNQEDWEEIPKFLYDALNQYEDKAIICNKLGKHQPDESEILQWGCSYRQTKCKICGRRLIEESEDNWVLNHWGV